MWTPIAFSRSKYSTPITPIVIHNTGTYSARIGVDKVCPVRQRASLSVYSYPVKPRLITCLFSWSAPFNVPHFVMSVIIYAVKGMLGSGLFADFIQKLFKGMKAKFNSAPSVPMVSVVRNIFAPCFGSTIRIAFWIINFGCSVCRWFITSARGSHTTSKILATDYGKLLAIASA